MLLVDWSDECLTAAKLLVVENKGQNALKKTVKRSGR